MFNRFITVAVLAACLFVQTPAFTRVLPLSGASLVAGSLSGQVEARPVVCLPYYGRCGKTLR